MQSLLTPFRLLPPPPAPPPTETIILRSGPLDGKERSVPSGSSRVGMGVHHEPDWSIIDFYDRTADRDPQGRAVFLFTEHIARRRGVTRPHLRAVTGGYEF